MDWVQSTEDPNEGIEALTQTGHVVRPPASKVTDRKQKLSKDVGSGDVLDVFPPAYPGESLDSRKERFHVYDESVADITKELQVVQRQSQRGIFDRLLSFAQGYPASHPIFQQQSLPTAIVFSGGINAADHAHTFKRLKEVYKSKGSRAALLDKKVFQNGVPDALRSILCQFSGLNSPADDVMALTAWYQDELAAFERHQQQHQAGPSHGTGDGVPTAVRRTSRKKAGGKTGSPPAAAPYTMGAMDSNTSVPHEGGARAHGGGARTAPAGALGSGGPMMEDTGRWHAHLDDIDDVGETVDEPLELVEDVVPQFSDRMPELVVIIEEAEALDPATFRDLVGTLSEEAEDLPIILVLGIATSPSIFMKSLPLAVCSRLVVEEFSLPPAPQVLEHLFSRVVLGTRALPPVVLGHDAAALLGRCYRELDLSVTSFKDSLQVGCLLHYQHQPLSGLAQAVAMGGRAELHEACEGLPWPLLKHIRGNYKEYVSKGQGASNDMAVKGAVEEAVWQAVVAFGKWRLGLQWLHSTAALTGALLQEPSYKLSHLYVLASAPSFWAFTRDTESPAQQLISQLCGTTSSTSVRVLELSDCQRVLERLLQHLNRTLRLIGEESDLEELQDQVESLLAEMDPTRTIPGTASLLNPERPAVPPPPPTIIVPDLPTSPNSTKMLLDVETPAGQRTRPPLVLPSPLPRITPMVDKLAVSLTLQSPGLRGPEAAGKKLLESFDGAMAETPRGGRGLVIPNTPRGARGPLLSRQDRLKGLEHHAQKLKTQVDIGGDPREKTKEYKTQALINKVADFLREALQSLLHQRPFDMVGMDPFCIKDSSALASYLVPSPRTEVHEALLCPGTHLSSITSDNMTRDWDDTCIAYFLFDQHSESVDVAEWFGDFCQVYGVGADLMEEDPEDQPKRSKSRKNPRKGKYGRIAVDQDQVILEDQEKPGQELAKSLTRGKKVGRGSKCGPTSAPPVEASPETMMELAARFCQAASELQFLGMWRSVKRKKQAAVQKMCFT